MYTPGGRTGRTQGSVKPIVAAVAVALMGMGGVALAAPKADPGPPEQAQGNGPPPQAQDPAPAPEVKVKANGHAQLGTNRPAEVPPALPPQARADDNRGSGAGQGGHSGQQSGQGASGGQGHHGRPAPGENRGNGPKSPNPGNSSGCRAARCHGATPEPIAVPSGGSDEQPEPVGGQQGTPAGDVLGVSDERPDDDPAGAPTGESQTGGFPESGSALGLNEGGGEEAYVAPRNFDGALPFTGLQLALLAGIGALLGLAGLRLRRSTA